MIRFAFGLKICCDIAFMLHAGFHHHEPSDMLYGRGGGGGGYTLCLTIREAPLEIRGNVFRPEVNQRGWISRV